jgi:hypothetical protein
MRLSLEVVYMRRCLIHPEGGVAADLRVPIPLAGDGVTIGRTFELSFALTF